MDTRRNFEQEGLALVETALREGRISVEEARDFTEQLVPDDPYCGVDVFTYRGEGLHLPDAAVAAAYGRLKQHLAPKRGIAAFFRRRRSTSPRRAL